MASPTVVVFVLGLYLTCRFFQYIHQQCSQQINSQSLYGYKKTDTLRKNGCLNFNVFYLAGSWKSGCRFESVPDDL